jgi:hypothetical protein
VGVSHEAQGKCVCLGGQCDLLIAVPVKSFDSKDNNRDLHMLQVTRGGQFPMVTVRILVPESELTSATIHCVLETRFAGQTAHAKQIAFQREAHGNESRITGTIPVALSDFNIDPPSLPAMPVKDGVPIKVEMSWHSMDPSVTPWRISLLRAITGYLLHSGRMRDA